jgi:hypothetical protein
MAKEWGDAAMEVKEIHRFSGELLFRPADREHRVV